MLLKFLYNGLILPVAAGGGYLVALFHPKLGQAVAERRGLRGRWREARRLFGEAPVWFHVASVGEFEQAKPVISSLKKNHPRLPVAVTFSSPSGFHYARKKETLGADNNIKFIDYLPADFLHNARFCLDSLRPRLLVLVKFDLWPNLIWETRRRGVPIILIDATLSPSSSRFTGIGRVLYRSLYRDINKILTISDSDADRFRLSVPAHPSISVVGDTRFDRVMERKTLASPVGFDFSKNTYRVVVAGSTWPPDEARLLPALATLLSRDPDLRLILAPHEPLEDRINELSAWARSAGISACRARELGGGDVRHPQVIIIDTVGVLAEAYRYGDVAYVGGGFSTGVHSVIEPAIEGLPVVFGPEHDNSFEALRLIETGAGFAVRGADDVLAALEKLLYDADARSLAGERARRYVESQLGATKICVAEIEEYL